MLPSQEINEVLQKKMPQTWKKFHTPDDNFESLTPQSFELFFNILNNLAIMKTPAM